MSTVSSRHAPRQPIGVVLIGAGAVVREYQGPSAAEAERLGLIKVIAVVDREPDQLTALGSILPSARRTTDLEIAEQADLALVATPPTTHAALARELLTAYNCHLLVEKPLTTNAEEAQGLMTLAAERSRVLAVAHFRRFFPALETLAQLINSRVFGPPRRVTVEEGSLFRWPATAAFFTPETAGGGVTLDIGVHVLELLVSWFGTPEVLDYQDDAMGGVEINSYTDLRWPSGLLGSVQLSWDVSLRNRYVVEFDRATVTWKPGQAVELLLEIHGMPGVQALTPRVKTGASAEHTIAPTGYLAAFTRQWIDVVQAINDHRAPTVSDSAVTAVEIISHMYSRRRLLQASYWTDQEALAARRLAEESIHV